jgi:Cu(I)/Ag(I) efflux system membrane fusion protein
VTRRRLGWASALLVAAGVVAVTAGVSHRVDPAGSEREAPLYYVDPMHPAYTSAQPGTAPDCGMQLVPVYARDTKSNDEVQHGDGLRQGYGARAVHVNAEQRRLIGLEIAVAETTAGVSNVRLPARVVADESRLYKVNVGIAGFVRDLSTVTAGSLVTAGQWLATFSAPEARTAIQGYLIAVDAAERARRGGDGDAQLELATAGVAQAEDRLLNLGMSPRQIAEVRRTRIVPPDIEVAAPGSGIVLTRNVSLGERFDRGAELYRIADLRRVWIVADLFGIAAEHVRAGAAAQIDLPNQTGSIHAAVSTTVLPEFDPATQSHKLRFEANNPDLVLRPGMLVDVVVPIEVPAALTVPVDAVIDAGPHTRVVVEQREGVFVARDVVTGWRFGDRVAIVKGLEPGARVAVGGAFLLDAESRLQHARGR